MNGFVDTIVWLANFPATHGFTMVFIASFGLFGLIAMATAGGRSSSTLARLRAETGGPQQPQHPARQAGRIVQTWVYRVVAVVVLACGVLGVLSLIIGHPVTSSYISDNGATTTGRYESGTVTFTAEDGRTYRIPVDTMTEPVYPGSYVPSGPVEIRYLPSHPQAFVIVGKEL